MSQNRKLQAEIDRILKKVQEGCAEFDSILSKVYSATSTNQKEKYEADLKKEIKKLQRVRDQIKTWISSNEVRQKNPLLEARRTIETKMEQFKACERDSKTKAYSKEGLALDEDDDAKKEARSWIGKSLKDLQTQIDTFETEIETVPVKKRPGNARVDHLNDWISRHKFHINKLEKVLRALDNDAVGSDQITEIEDSINHYIEHNQDSDFFEEEDVYESLGLKESDYEDSLRSSGEFSNENSDIDDDDDMMSQTSTSSTGSVNSKKSTEPAPSAPVATQAPSMRASGSNIPTPTSASPSAPFSILQAVKQTTNPLSRSDGITKATIAPAAKAQPAPPVAQPAAAAQPTRKGPAPAPVPAPTQPGPTISQPQPQRIMKPPSAWPGIGQSQPSVPPAVTAPPPQATASAPSTPQPPPGLAQPQPQQPVQQLQSGQKTPDEIYNRANPTVHFNQFVRNAPQQHPGIQFAATGTTSQSPSPQPTPVQPPTMGLPGAHLDERATRSPSLPPQPPIQAHSQGQANFQRFPSQAQLLDDTVRPDADLDDRKNDETFGNINVSASDPGTLADLAATTQHKLSTPQPQQAQAFPVSGEQDLSAMAMLDCSLKNIPEQYDSERIKPYVPRSPHPTPNYYPQNPAPIFENPALFENFDTDTLFFIFYYQQGTYQQYLAAKELKKQSWRYHKKYLTWFQRHEEPKEITNDYEQGTYVYFDYETGWCQRKKTEFTFEYRYLEDYD